MFVNNVFQLVGPFIANLHLSTVVPKNTHIWTQWPQKNFNSFFTYEYQKYSEFYVDFKSKDIIAKKCTQKELFAKNVYKLVV